MNDRERAFRAKLADLIGSGKLVDGEGKRVPLHAAVTEDEAFALYRAAYMLKPTCSLEVGLGQGVSTFAILHALEDRGSGRHHVVDPFEASFDDTGLATVERVGLAHRMTFHRSHLEEVFHLIPRVKFAFIDASHLFDLTLSAFAMVDRRLHVGGVVGFHDTWLPSQQKIVRYILANRHYAMVTEKLEATPPRRGRLERLPALNRILKPEVLRPWRSIKPPGLCLLRKTGDDDRRWNFHREF